MQIPENLDALTLEATVDLIEQIYQNGNDEALFDVLEAAETRVFRHAPASLNDVEGMVAILALQTGERTDDLDRHALISVRRFLSSAVQAANP